MKLNIKYELLNRLKITFYKLHKYRYTNYKDAK